VWPTSLDWPKYCPTNTYVPPPLHTTISSLARGWLAWPQHYLVLPHPTILAHKSALSTSLAPQIDQLITKAESSVEAEQGRVKRLEERLSILQSARLPLLPETSFREHDTEEEIGGVGVEEEDEGSKLVGLEMKELNPAQRRKVVMLKAKRERLEKERARLAGWARSFAALCKVSGMEGFTSPRISPALSAEARAGDFYERRA